jgi:hypothetical protein
MQQQQWRQLWLLGHQLSERRSDDLDVLELPRSELLEPDIGPQQRVHQQRFRLRVSQRRQCCELLVVVRLQLRRARLYVVPRRELLERLQRERLGQRQRVERRFGQRQRVERRLGQQQWVERRWNMQLHRLGVLELRRHQLLPHASSLRGQPGVHRLRRLHCRLLDEHVQRQLHVGKRDGGLSLQRRAQLPHRELLLAVPVNRQRAVKATHGSAWRSGLLVVALPLAACGGAATPAPLAPSPVAVTLPPPEPPPPPSEPQGLAVVSAPPRVCELRRPLERGPIELGVLPKVDAFGQVAAGVLTVGFGEPGAFAEVRTTGWSLRGIPPQEATRVSAARWIAFGGVLYASKRDRFTVAGTRSGKLLLSAPASAGFTPAEGATTRETACDEVSLVVDPDGALGRDLPPAFVPAKVAQTVILRRAQPVPISADFDGAPGGTIDADDTDLKVTLLERRGKRARVRLGHVAGWVDGAVVVQRPPPRPQPKKKPDEQMTEFGMIGLLSASSGNASLSAADRAPPPPAHLVPGATDTTASLVCAADVRLVVDWTSSDSIAASAGSTPTARHYVVGVVPAGKPVRVIERGPELSTVSLGEGAFLPRGYARLTVPSRDLASGCAPAAAAAEPATRPSQPVAVVTDSTDATDAIDRLAGPPSDEVATKASIFGDAIGESFGVGGLGLTGSGVTGNGTIGLGNIGGIGQRFGGASSKPAPNLRQGTTEVSGRLPPEVIQRIVRQNFGRFRLCYENGLKTKPGIAGKVTVRFVIDGKGEVTSVSDAGSDLPSPSTVSCVVRAFSNLSFPQPESGKVTVTFPILFAPQ